jgi:ATP-dependent RNA helicase HelY
VNLIDAFGRQRAREVLEMSFAQFQADRSVVGLARGIREKQISLEGYESAMACHLGDYMHYASIRREISDIEKALSAGRVREQRGKDLRQSQGRSQQEKRLNQLKEELKRHPCHSCNEREAHARWAERYFKLRRETDAIIDQIEGRTNQVAKTFDKICSLLVDLEYLNQNGSEIEVLDNGRLLARIYGDRDLLISECIKNEIWQDLDAPNLAAMAAALVYEARRDDDGLEVKLPKGNFKDILGKTEDVWYELEMLAKHHRLSHTSALDAALCLPIHKWASGARLDAVLGSADLLPGDFIRWTKQIIDLLDQISQVATPKLAQTAKDAMDKVKRGIVAYSYYG